MGQAYERVVPNERLGLDREVGRGIHPPKVPARGLLENIEPHFRNWQPVHGQTGRVHRVKASGAEPYPRVTRFTSTRGTSSSSFSMKATHPSGPKAAGIRMSSGRNDPR